MALSEDMAENLFSKTQHTKNALLNSMLIVDPSANLILRFPADADPKGMLADLEILVATEIIEKET